MRQFTIVLLAAFTAVSASAQVETDKKNEQVQNYIFSVSAALAVPFTFGLSAVALAASPSTAGLGKSTGGEGAAVRPVSVVDRLEDSCAQMALLFNPKAGKDPEQLKKIKESCSRQVGSAVTSLVIPAGAVAAVPVRAVTAGMSAGAVVEAAKK